MSLVYGPGDYGGYAEHYEYEGFYPGSPCSQIAGCDPQGGDHEPTQAEMDGRRKWAIRTYGYEPWCSYSGEGRTYPEKPRGDGEPGK